MTTALVALPASGPALPVTNDAREKMGFFEQLIREYDQSCLLDELATHIRTCFQDAERHKIASDVEKNIMRAMRAVNLVYDPEDMALLENPNEVYIGLTNMKVRALKSWITDILANSEDQPWTLKPTPIPELPPEAEEAVIDALMREIQMYGMQNVDLKAKAKYFKDIARKHADKLAEEATGRMETRIADVMIEGGWRETFTHFVSDLATFPAGIMKGPVAQRSAGLRWDGDQIIPVKRLKWQMRRVHPLDFYPSPNATSVNEAEYVIERMAMTRAEMLEAATVPGFKEEAIRRLILDFPSGNREMIAVDAERSNLENLDRNNFNPTDKRYDVFVYHGRVLGEMLAKHGVEIEDFQQPYEAEVWVCANQVMYATLNPHPLGHRPYYVCSFEPVPGTLWGRGLPQLLRDVQRVCNAACRSLVRNMAFASGPVGEYDVDRLANETNIDNVLPFRMYAVTNDAQYQQVNAPALRFTRIDSNAGELLKVMEYYSDRADDISGIPAYVLGNPDTAGAGRTLGGLSLLMGNAAKGVKHVISGIDRYVIEPVVNAHYTMLMLYDDDRTLKADCSVIARGSAGLLQRELSQARAVEVLQVITPYAQAGIVPPEGLQVVIRDVLRGLGYRADDIVPDPQRQSQVAAFVNSIQAQTAGGLNEPAQPELDGRSAPATGQMEQMALPGNPGPGL